MKILYHFITNDKIVKYIMKPERAFGNSGNGKLKWSK